MSFRRDKCFQYAMTKFCSANRLFTDSCRFVRLDTVRKLKILFHLFSKFLVVDLGSLCSSDFAAGNEFRKAFGQAPKQRINSVRVQDIFSQEASSPSSPSVNLSAFDYSGSRSVQRSHSSSSTSGISTHSSKSRHRSKSHGDEFIKKQVCPILCTILYCY